ncbi:MAG: hypothetical protein FWG29_03440 [Treponema sp.]|nr:hypothetical protein [Treponema sp.]
MTITQTVDIPESHRLTIDVPREIPAGPVVLAFMPKAVPENKTVPPFASLWGIDKGRDTLDAYFERKRADKAKEDAQITRSLGLNKLPVVK